jgi:peroxiredoxin
MDSRNSFRPLLGLAAVLTLALFWFINDSFTERIVEKGMTAPSFRIVTDSGRTITPREFGGRLLVLNFWATWCPPCVSETPALSAMAERLKGEGVVVVGVSVDKNDAAYRAFVQRNRVAFETMRDPEARLSASFGTFKFPETYVITPDGKVVEKYISDQDWTGADILGQLRSHL